MIWKWKRDECLGSVPTDFIPVGPLYAEKLLGDRTIVGYCYLFVNFVQFLDASQKLYNPMSVRPSLRHA